MQLGCKSCSLLACTGCVHRRAFAFAALTPTSNGDAAATHCVIAFQIPSAILLRSHERTRPIRGIAMDVSRDFQGLDM
jgi:hypothetical protein